MDPDADIEFRRIKRRESLIPADVSESRAAETARWFSNGYYQVSKSASNEWVVSDLRLGEYPSEVNGYLRYDFVLSWKLTKQENGEVQFQNQWSNDRDLGGTMQKIWARILGDKNALSRP